MSLYNTLDGRPRLTDPHLSAYIEAISRARANAEASAAAAAIVAAFHRTDGPA